MAVESTVGAQQLAGRRSVLRVVRVAARLRGAADGCTGDANCTVTPGDDVTVSISQVSGNTWNISMTDAGHWSWSKQVSYSSSLSSGEWILEAPTLVAQTVLAPVGTVYFGPTSTYTSGGVTHTIAEGDPTQIDLSPGVVNEATRPRSRRMASRSTTAPTRRAAQLRSDVCAASLGPRTGRRRRYVVRLTNGW